MKLSLKITLFLFLLTALFIALLSVYYSSEINRNFREQADRLLKQSVTLTQQRIDLLKEQLKAEMNSLAKSFFAENEVILASLFSDPPVYNAEVVGFAEKLRRRTSLDFLYLISGSGTILSNSFEPAAFGKRDAYPQLPMDSVIFLTDSDAAMELKKQVQFGKHSLSLRGGYFLKDKLPRISSSTLQVTYIPGEFPTPSGQPAQPILRQTIDFDDPYGERVATITVSVSQQELLKQKHQILTNSFYLLAGSLLLCLLIGWLISHSISRPLKRLTEAAEQMSSGNFDVRVEDSANGEIGRLVDAFNTMTEQLDANRRKLIQTERIAAWQEIARHLAHEIKNPLTPIRTSIANLRLAMEKVPDQFPEIFRESSDSIIEEVEALRNLADEFAGFARLPAPHLQLRDLNETVQKTVALYKNSIPSNVQLSVNLSQLPSFYFDPDQIGQVLQNLLKNSIEAMNDGGTILIATSLKENKWASLEIQDSGPGMTDQIKQQVFTPYFSTKQRGTGLGLAIVQRIVTEHGGNILVESEPGKGTKFEVRLPVANSNEQ
jgi:signal transduction histidine kinase